MALVPISKHRLFTRMSRPFIYSGMVLVIEYYNKIPVSFILYNTINNKADTLVYININWDIDHIMKEKTNSIKGLEEFWWYSKSELELSKKAIDKFFRYVCHIKFDKKYNRRG